jgi:hypothetical protein
MAEGITAGTDAMTEVSRPTTNTKLADRIRRFPDRYHAQLAAFAAISKRLGQLAHAYPLLFFLLATGHGPACARRNAVRLAEAGRPLAEIARAMGLPNCFRKLPPEACYLPYEPARWSSAADRLLGPYVPTQPSPHVMTWLRAANYACRACDEAFAAWVIREAFAHHNRYLVPAILPLAVFAWHSRCSSPPPSISAGRRWSPRLGARRALSWTLVWLQRLSATVGLPEGGIRDPWISAGSAEGHEFTPLLTLAQLNEEARAMENCVDTYGSLLASNICRLFSVTRDGVRVATLEVGWSSTDGELVINDIRGPRNAVCPGSVYAAAETWLALPHNQLAREPLHTSPRSLDEFLEPYRAATNCGEDQWATGLTVLGLQRIARSAAIRARQEMFRRREAPTRPLTALEI